MKKKLPSNYYLSIVIFSAKFLPKNKKDQKNLETEIKYNTGVQKITYVTLIWAFFVKIIYFCEREMQ